MIDKQSLTSALIDAVEITKGRQWKKVVLGLKRQLKNGEEPNIAGVAKTLGVPLERLLAEFSRCAFEAIGEVILPARLH